MTPHILTANRQMLRYGLRKCRIRPSKTIVNPHTTGRRPNGFLGLSLNDRTILFLLILLDKTVFAFGASPHECPILH